MTNRPVLVGLAPGKGPNEGALHGRIGRRLSGLAGLDVHEVFDARNVLPTREDGDRWPITRPLAVQRAAQILARYTDAPIVLFGRRVESVFVDRGPRPWGIWEEITPWRFVVLPHPSGLSRPYNDPGVCALVGRILREAAGRTDVPALSSVGVPDRLP